MCVSPCQSLPLTEPPFRTCKPCGLLPYFFPHTILEPIQEPLYTTIPCPLSCVLPVPALTEPPFRTYKPCRLLPFLFCYTILEPIQEPLYNTTIPHPLYHMCFPMSVLVPDGSSLQNLQTLRIAPIFLPSHHT